MNSDWLIPDWPAPRQVRAVCTTRAGGHSKPPFDALNLGDHVGDQPLAVAGHRALLAHALGARPGVLWPVAGPPAPDGAPGESAGELVGEGTVEPAPDWLQCRGARWVLRIDARGVRRVYGTFSAT